MLNFIRKLFIINPKNAYKIKNHIFKQSRKSNLYLNFNIKDNFDNRLNFIILHLSLVIIIINTKFEKNYIGFRLNKKIFKYFFEEIDLSFRENAYGDKTIERKIFEINNLIISQYEEYRILLQTGNNSLLSEFLKKNFYNDVNNNKINILDRYIKVQLKYLKSIDFLNVINQDIFSNWILIIIYLFVIKYCMMYS